MRREKGEREREVERMKGNKQGVSEKNRGE